MWVTKNLSDPLTRRFQELARIDPSAHAVYECGAVITRGELWAAATRAATAVSAACVEPGATVGLAARPGAAFLVAFLALRTRGCCVALLDESHGRGAFVSTLERIGATHAWRPGAEDWNDLSPPVPVEGTRPAPPRNAAVVKMTSGSEGDPVGVFVTDEALWADGSQLAASMELTPADRFLCVVPFSHAYGFSLLPTSLFARGSALIVPGDEDSVQAAARLDATVVPSVPTWYRSRLRAFGDGARWPKSLRLHLSAGAPLAPEIAREFRRVTGRPVHVLYGSTECGGITFDRQGGAAERGEVGTEVEGVRVSLRELDGDNCVYVRSKAVAEGYTPTDPVRGAHLASGAFQTEDVAEWTETGLRLTGRRSRWINVNGHKVDPVAVEHVLLEIEGVEEVAVLGRDLGEGRGEAIRAVLGTDGRPIPFRVVTAWCRDRLAPYQIPRSVVIIDRLPRNGRGKLDRAALESL